MTTITVGSAVDLINSSFTKFEDGLDSDSINDIIYAVNNDLQVRDYLIGLPAVHPMEKCVDFLSYLADSIGEHERYALDTVNAMFHYELEDMEAVDELLSESFLTRPDYSLTQLIMRVVKAGWPSDSFVSMRNDLAPKVNGTIQDEADRVIA